MALPVNAVAAVLVSAMKHDIDQQGSRGMSELTSDVLSLWKQSCSAPWALQLTSEAASMLAILLNKDNRWSEAAAVFQERLSDSKGSQVVTHRQMVFLSASCTTSTELWYQYAVPCHALTLYDTFHKDWLTTLQDPLASFRYDHICT